MKRILIVDDEESILTVLTTSLKSLGKDIQIETASDGDSAIAQLQQTPFDLVITDYMMAGMDGLEVLAEIRTLQPSVRVIMITAYGTDELFEEAQRLHVDKYVTKPLEIDHFRQIVSELLIEAAGKESILPILSDELSEKLKSTMEGLRIELNARSVFICNTHGAILSHVGEMDITQSEGIASLLGKCIETLLDAGKKVDGNSEGVNFAYREGKRQILSAVNVGKHLLLILVLDQGDIKNRLGTIWFNARNAALTLDKIIPKMDR